MEFTLFLLNNWTTQLFSFTSAVVAAIISPSELLANQWFIRLDMNGVSYCTREHRSFTWGKRRQWEPKQVLLPPFSCLIVHARIALYAFVNSESPRSNWTIVQLNCDLEETLPVNSPPRYFPHSFLLSFPHIQALIIHTQKKVIAFCQFVNLET